MKKLIVGLAGNPNVGKTTVFNRFTGMRQHVGNWPGKTVERAEGNFNYKTNEINVIDLPGNYSLTAYSPEEVISRDYIINEQPDVISHNMETVRRLTPVVRSVATYDRSLQVLKQIAESPIPAKTGIMVGLGETIEEVEETMDDLLTVGCSILTIGQYLQPTRKHYPVQEYVTPQQFDSYKETALDKGFKMVESGPLVRSSYYAEKVLNKKI